MGSAISEAFGQGASAGRGASRPEARQNIMLTKTGAKLLDFGLAKATVQRGVGATCASPSEGRGGASPLHEMKGRENDAFYPDPEVDLVRAFISRVF